MHFSFFFFLFTFFNIFPPIPAISVDPISIDTISTFLPPKNQHSATFSVHNHPSTHRHTSTSTHYHNLTHALPLSIYTHPPRHSPIHPTTSDKSTNRPIDNTPYSSILLLLPRPFIPSSLAIRFRSLLIYISFDITQLTHRIFRTSTPVCLS